jgi:signal transduction histidine kinase
MKPDKLYFRILLSFLTVLFITFLVIFALFHALPGKHLTVRLEDFAETKALILKEAIEDKIRSAPSADLSKNEPLKEFIMDFGHILGAKVWLQNPDNTIPIKSFSKEIPKIVFKVRKNRAWVFGNVTFYHQRGFDFYAVMPFTLLNGEKGTIHVLFENPAMHSYPDHPERIFALGLFLIGLMAAMLFVPISRIITNRLKNLRQSALTISEGNLSYRAAIGRQDEIGELALAFNRMADKLETMILNARELTANVSHELRTPLTRIRIAQEMLREKLEKEDASPYESYLDTISEDIQELDRLIGRILELFKWDMQGSPLTFASFDPSGLMEALLQRFQPVIRHKDLKVDSALAAVPFFSGDQEALTTVFLNILDNAVKFAPEKGRIKVRMCPSPGSLKISISNTYEKLSPEELIRIFDPFHRAKPIGAAGSGLGLAIAKKIVEGHGGVIGAYNTEEGLEISLSLPRQESGLIRSLKVPDAESSPA